MKIGENTHSFLQNLSTEMSFSLQKNVSIGQAIHYLCVSHVNNATEFEEYQEKFKEIKQAYNLSLTGIRAGKKQYISEIREMKEKSAPSHVLPPISTGNINWGEDRRVEGGTVKHY